MITGVIINFYYLHGKDVTVTVTTVKSIVQQTADDVDDLKLS